MQCSVATFGKDFGDFADITSQAEWLEEKAAVVLCEGCGAIQVDPEGRCISADCGMDGHNESK